MVIYLLVLAILAFAFLVLMFLNYRRVSRSGLPERFKFLRVIFSWLLIFTMIGSIGGAAYAATHPEKKTETKVVKKTTKKTSHSSSMNDTLDVTFSKKNPTLDAEGKVTVKLYVSSKTSVKIIGHSSRTVYKTFAAGTKNKAQTFSYTFTDPGTYDVELTRGDTSVTKSIKISGDLASTSSSATADSTDSTSDNSTTTTTNGGTGSGSPYSGGTGTSNGSTGGSYNVYNDGSGTSNTTPETPSTGDNTGSGETNTGGDSGTGNSEFTTD